VGVYPAAALPLPPRVATLEPSRQDLAAGTRPADWHLDEPSVLGPPAAAQTPAWVPESCGRRKRCEKRGGVVMGWRQAGEIAGLAKGSYHGGWVVARHWVRSHTTLQATRAYSVYTLRHSNR
jgi:hypothetical protein